MFTTTKETLLKKFQAHRNAKLRPLGTAILLTLTFAIASGMAYPPGRTAQAAGETENGANTENTANASNPTFVMGSSETLMGPSWKIDTPFHTIGRTPNVIGYMGNSKSWAYTTSDLRTLTLIPGIALDKGPDGSFDGCPGGGAWLESTYTDPSNPLFVRGWYHAETEAGCDASASTRKSVGYAESRDGGKTFTKPNYPYNQVITAPSQYTDGLQGSEGDQHVIRVGDYFYMYFVAARDSHKIHLARSRVSDGGKPGTWYKWYNGSFSQPGLGGESTAIASGSVLGRAWVSYNSYLREYIGFSWSTTGFGISLSPDGITWRRVTGDILLTNHQFHNRTSSSGVLIEYPSLIGLDGNPDVQGGQMWLYYMKVDAGASMTGDTRYLIRRSFSIEGSTAPTDTPLPQATSTSIPSNTSTPVPPTEASTATATATSVEQQEPSHTATRTAESTHTSTIPTHTATRQTAATSTNVPAPPAATATATATVSARNTTGYTFYATADATLRQDQPNANVGTSSNLHVDDERSSDLRTYLKFSVSGISGTVQSAKLRVYAYGGTVDGPALYGTSNISWSETGITWNTRPAASTGIVDDKGAIGDNVWVEYNVQPLLSSGGNGTYTFILMAYSPDAAHFYSRQAGLYEGKSHLVPQLVLTAANYSANDVTNTQSNSSQEAQPVHDVQFTDLPADSPYYSYVNVAVAERVISGYSDSTFRSNEAVTRGQLSKIVALALDYGAYAGDYLVADLINNSGPSGTGNDASSQVFQDVPVDSTYFNYISKLSRVGIVSGYACGTRADEPCVGTARLPYFRVSASASRGQIAKIVSTAAGFSPIGGSNSAVGEQMFEDVASDSAFFTYVQDLVAHGVMSGYACGGNNEPCSGDQRNRPYFRPSMPATRGQLTKIVVNTFFP